MEIPSGALVVLAGPSGSGKSTWAARHLRPDLVVSSDALRAVVGLGPDDQRAGGDAFDVLELIVERRLTRGLTTVIDSLGLDDELRGRWRDIAVGFDRPTVAIAFDIPDAECRRRNKARERPVPSKAVTSQLRRWPEVRDRLAAEFDEFHVVVAETADEPVDLVPEALHRHRARRLTQREDPMPLRFGLSISTFTWPGETADLAPTLGRIAADAEEAGFSSLWVMDHVMQIPQVGREWEPMLESTTTLGFLAAATESIRIGALVNGITYRNVAHLGKMVATLDVLSGGRATCGLGAAWFDREHRAYGWDMPPIGERYELLEDALELFPLLWGPGSPAFEGRRVTVPEAICYPRPIQERIPILVGGSGERRTLRLVARHADACNLFGEPDLVRRKVDVLGEHCRVEGRDPSEIAITQLSSILCAADTDQLTTKLDARSGTARPAEIAASHLTAGTVEQHVGRFRALAEAGVDEVIVSLADVGEAGAVATFADVVGAFR